MYFFQNAVIKMLRLKRNCPVCKKEQIVKPSEATTTVRCKFCGAIIPPPKVT